SRSFSRCRRAISAAWSADGSAACVMGRRSAAVGSCPTPRFSTHRRNTESRRPSSFATDVTDRPLEATRSTACCLYSWLNDRRRRPSIRHLLALGAYYRCPLIRRRFNQRYRTTIKMLMKTRYVNPVKRVARHPYPRPPAHRASHAPTRADATATSTKGATNCQGLDDAS